MAFLQRHKGLFIAALISILGFFPLMGAPGFALISLFQWLISVLTDTPYDVEYGDSTWPMAIMYAIAFPWVVFVSYTAIKRLPAAFQGFCRGKRGILLAGVVALLGLFAFHAAFCNPEDIRAERAQMLKDMTQN